MDYLETLRMVESLDNLHMCSTRFCQSDQLFYRHREYFRTCLGRSNCCYTDIERNCCCLSWMGSYSEDNYSGDNYSVGSYCIHSCSHNYCCYLLPEDSQDQRTSHLARPSWSLSLFSSTITSTTSAK